MSVVEAGVCTFLCRLDAILTGYIRLLLRPDTLLEGVILQKRDTHEVGESITSSMTDTFLQVRPEDVENRNQTNPTSSEDGAVAEN